MKFDEWYPPYMKRGIVQRKCECTDCRESTFWRYDYKTEHERIFFAACSSECLSQIIKSGLRNPVGDIIIPIEPKKAALRAIENAF